MENWQSMVFYAVSEVASGRSGQNGGSMLEKVEEKARKKQVTSRKRHRQTIFDECKTGADQETSNNSN